MDYAILDMFANGSFVRIYAQ